ncbi:MAG: ArnT family glycosyltransferase [Candidatus Omnitrophota bacterium]
MILSMPHGIFQMLNYESFKYLSGAESIIQNGTYRHYGGKPTYVTPPGTSLLYAGFAALTSKPPESMILPLNILCYLVTAVSLYLLLRQIISNGTLRSLILICVLLNPPFLALHNRMLSEAPCMAFFMLSNVFFVKVLTNEKRQAMHGVMALFFLGWAAFIRHAVIALVPLFLGALYLALEKKTKRGRIWTASLLAATLPSAILWHMLKVPRPNLLFQALPRSEGGKWHPPSIEGVLTLGPWANKMVGGVLDHRAAIIFLSILFILIPFAALGLTCQKPGAERERRVLLFFALGPVFYVLFLFFIHALGPPTFVESNLARYLSLMFPYSAIAAILACQIFYKIARQGSTILWQRAGKLCLVFTLAGLGVIALHNVHSVSGVILKAKPAVDSPQTGRKTCVGADSIVNALRKYAADHPDFLKGDRIFMSNYPGLAWYALRREMILLEPRGFRRAKPATGGTSPPLTILYLHKDEVCPNASCWSVTRELVPYPRIADAENSEVLLRQSGLSILELSDPTRFP